MTSLQLKAQIIERISKIQDFSILKSIEDYLDLSSKTMILSDDLIADIEDSKKEIENGNYIENSQLKKNIAQWLNEK